MEIIFYQEVNQASFVVIDAVLRLLPDILGNKMSKNEESFEDGLLEYPQYTKPQVWEEKSVPEVLIIRRSC